MTNIPGIGPVPTDPKGIARLKAKLKADLDNHFRERGFLPTHEELRAAEDSGELAWIFITKHNSLDMAMGHITKSATEPFPARLLEALEHILKHGDEAQLKLTAATLLYRYGRESGRTALLELLKQGGADGLAINAAITLALNKDEEGKAGILTLLSRMPDSNPSFLRALGLWNDPAVKEALVQKLGLAPRSSSLAYALAFQDDASGLPALKDAFKRQRGEMNFISLQLEAALARLEDPESSEFRQHFDGMLLKQPTSAGDLMPILEHAGSRVGGPELLKILEDFVPQHQQWVKEGELQAQKVKASDPTAYHSYPKPIPFTALPGAALFAADWELKAAVPLLERVIVEMQQGPKTFNDLNQQLGLALYRLDPANWRNTLINAGIKLEHIDRIPEFAKLRPVAHDQVPQQKNLVWR